MTEAWRDLRVGDRVRLIFEPPQWQQPEVHVPTETRELWQRLMQRRRPIRIVEVDEWGVPWIRCRIKKSHQEWETHFLAIVEDGWARV